MNSQDKDMMYMRFEIDQLRRQLSELRGTVRDYVGNFERPELICPGLVEAIDPDRYAKILKKSKKAA
jgi:hypothetical protein